jgi:hypothetical protein
VARFSGDHRTSAIDLTQFGIVQPAQRIDRRSKWFKSQANRQETTLRPTTQHPTFPAPAIPFPNRDNAGFREYAET